MADITRDPLADLLLGTGQDDYMDSPAWTMVCTAWNPTTRQNTVTDGAATYTDLLCVNPAIMVTGRCLVVRTGGRPVILGPLYGPTV